jgi:hypothetical protein
MKKLLFILVLFTAFVTGKAQDKPIVFLSPDASFYIDCSDTSFDKNKTDSLIQSCIEMARTKYSSILSPTSFNLLEVAIWNNFTTSECVEESVVTAKIKAIANEVKSIPSEAVLAFLTRFGFTPAFAVDKSVLSTQEEVLSFFQNTTDEFLLSARNELLNTHVEILLLVAKTLKKADACPLIKEAEDFSSKLAYPEAFEKDITDLKAATKCD